MYLTDRLEGLNTEYRVTEPSSETSVKFSAVRGCACPACCASGAGTSSFSGDGPQNLGNGPNGGNGYGLPSASWDDAAIHLNRGGASWNTTNGQGQTVITYSFRDANSSDNEPGFSSFNAAQIAAAETALQMWADVANIVFTRVDDGDGYSNDGAITFGNRTGSGQAYAYLPSSGNESASSLQGDIWIYSSAGSNFDLDPGEYGLLTLIHEIGHAIGFNHPGDYNGSASYTPDAEYYEDTRMYSVMSYFDEAFTGGSYGSFYTSGLMIHDIAAAQRLYGANTDTNSGNTRYGFNASASVQSWYDLNSASDDLAVSIWDGGGFDWLDFSGYSDDAIIRLGQQEFSSVGGLTNNVSIALGVEIEAAEGGSGNDELHGNELANRFWGNGGDDEIYGGGAQDRAYFAGNYNQYTVTREASGGFTVENTGSEGEGTDSLFNIRYAHFANQTIDLVRGIAGNRKVDVNEISFDTDINPTSTVAISSLFDISDPDADTVLLYRFKYSSDAVGTAYLDGVALNAGQWYILGADELADLDFTGTYMGANGAGDYAGKSQMVLRAYDGGYGWSAIGRIWVNVRDEAVNTAPVVAAVSANIVRYDGQSSDILALFDITDADGDSMTQYQVRDLDAGGASITVNGSTVGSGSGWTTVSIADIANTLVVGGSANSTSDIELRAYDGYAWSNFDTVTVDNTDIWAADATTIASMSTGGSIGGVLDYTGDRDWVAITLVAGQTYTFDLQGGPSGNGTLSDPLLRLYDTDGTTLLATNDDIQLGVQLESRITHTAATSGTYYLSAGSYNDGSSGTYLLSSSGGSAFPLQSASVASTTEPNWTETVDAGALSHGALQTTAKADWMNERFGMTHNNYLTA